MILPRPMARITHAAKLEFSSRDRSEKREQVTTQRGLITVTAANRRRGLRGHEQAGGSQIAGDQRRADRVLRPALKHQGVARKGRS